MSIKDLFGKKSSSISSREKDSTDYSEVESINYVEEVQKENIRFIPEIDYEEPANFARYGLAEKYYIDSIQQVYKTYPYDGSFYEKKKWHNERSDLTNYFFDNVYPRNNGYINIGYVYGSSTTSSDGYANTDRDEYIRFNGTLNQDNIYDPSNNREYNLKLNANNGATVEFYFKKEDLSGSQKQVIFDLWNSGSEGSGRYGRFKIEIHPGIAGEEDKFYIDLSSGSNGVVNAELGSSLDFTGSWHHYGVAVQNSGSQVKMQLFVDGDLHSQILTGSAISEVRGAIKAHIGSLIAPASGTMSAQGWGKLSGSLDEFRYWKTKRTDKDIALNYFTPVGGGTNTDTSNTQLGVYYKFNEGIYSTSSVSNYDKIVLDYSGRTTNGSWTGYSLGSRNTGSAIVLSGLAGEEFTDPVVYPGHPDIIALIEQYSEKGYAYDTENVSNLYSTLPNWIVDEDANNGSTTRDLFQIISELFDDLHNKIKFLPTIKNINYSQGKPLPFSLKLLEDVGFEAIDIFSDITVLEEFLTRNETENYEETISNLKNYIYQNIYNNILQIYRSKGTEKSFRNLMRCFGIDENLIKVNIYADNVEFTMDDNFKSSIYKTKTINFNEPNSFSSNVYQKADPSNTNSINYIPSSLSLKELGSTFEAEVLFPNKFSVDEPFFFETSFLSCSLFGIHESSNGTWTAPDRASIQVFAVRPKVESKDVYFQLSSSYLGINLTSSVYTEVYDNNKWNFALRIVPDKYPNTEYLSGSSIQNYTVDLYGVNYLQDIEEQSLLLSTTVTSSLIDGFYSANKMIYLGAHKTNFSGTVVNNQKSDVEFVSARYWHSYLSDNTINNHAKDSRLYGASELEYEKAIQQFILQNTASYGEQHLPQIKSLALYWNFENVGTETNGDFYVNDASSGSLSMLSEDLFSQYTDYQQTGFADFSIDSERPLKTQYLNTARLKMPEALNSDDLVQILETDDEYFTRNTRPVNHYFMLEKSMNSVISEEMLSWLGTASRIGNIIGNPRYRYEESYRELQNLKQLFFANVENEPDFERFMGFYKWIDNSLSLLLEQLIPASMNYSSNVLNVVESHILERNKYRHKLPTIEFTGDPPLGAAKTINELLYNWKTGHAPLSGLEKNNCVWWKLRAERIGSLNEERVGIFEVSTSALNRNFSTVYNLDVQIKGTFFRRIREPSIIIREVGFDLSGTPVVIPSVLPPNSDCDD